MDSEKICEYLDSDFDEFDDSDDDPTWEVEADDSELDDENRNQTNRYLFPNTMDNRQENELLAEPLYEDHMIVNEMTKYNSDISHVSDSDEDIYRQPPYRQPTNTHQLDREWRADDNIINNFIYNPNNEHTGINLDLVDTLIDGSPLEFYELLVSENILNTIVIETNRYAAQKIAEKVISPHSRIGKWQDTNIIEMKKFLGLLIWTGLVPLPSYELYWSNSFIFSTNFGKIMSRNRFEILIQMIHFSDNSQIDKNNRLYKLGTILDDVMINSNMCLQPNESFCIDESLIKCMGRLAFKQYIKNKRNKFGIKLVKLCTHPCYTLAIKVYCGKEANPECNFGSKIVQELSEPYLYCGRTLVVDNWYSSVELAELLNSKQTHLIGTLRTNRKSNPKEVTNKKLKKSEMTSMRSSSNVLVLKWRDKRDICMISTKHNSEMEEKTIRGKIIKKPKVVYDYNIGKSPIDLSDQMSSYSNPLRRSVKWYRKVVLDILLNVAVVNAFVLYTQVTKPEKMSITTFRTILVEKLIKLDDQPMFNITPFFEHKLDKVPKSRCYKCYSKMVISKGRQYAQSHSKKTSTKCLACNKHFCLDCFFEDHRTRRL